MYKKLIWMDKVRQKQMNWMDKNKQNRTKMNKGGDRCIKMDKDRLNNTFL